MRPLIIILVAVSIVSVASATADGTITNFSIHLEPWMNLPGGNYTVNRIRLDTTTDWLSAELIVLPDANGQVYEYWLNMHVLYHNPISAYSSDIAYDGDLAEYDTFVTDGLLIDGSPESAFTFTGNHGEASDPILGGLDYLLFGEDYIDLSYSTAASDDIGSLYLAQVTLNSAYSGGTWSFRAWTAEFGEVTPAYEAGGTIYNGALVPEPTTMLVMLGGSLALLRRRK